MINNATLNSAIIDNLLEVNQEIGDTKERLGAGFYVNPKQVFTSGRRLLSPYYLVGELLFSLAEDRSLDFIKYYSKFWEKISDDGETVRSAYWWQVANGHGFNQVDQVIEKLKKDPNTRQAILHIHHPHEADTKDEICTLSLQFFNRRGKLHMIVTMRSNDIILGLPYDVSVFAMLQAKIALSLGLLVGSYRHQAGSLHIYTRDIPKLKECTLDKTYALEFTKEFFEDKEKLLETEKAIRQDATYLQKPYKSSLAAAMALVLKCKGLPKDTKKQLILGNEHLCDEGLYQLLFAFEFGTVK